MWSSWFHHLWAYVTPSFAGHSFCVTSGKRGRPTICQFSVVHFGFCLISNIFSCSYACITLEKKLLTLISPIKI